MPKFIRLLVYMFGFIILACRPLINKLAFFPDKISSPVSLPSGVEETYISSSDGVKLQCLLLNSQSSRALLYCHGNAGTIIDRLKDLLRLKKMGLTVLGLGYRGYGRSEGKPSEIGIYKDAEAAFNYLLTLGFNSSQIIVMGRSIGTTAATHVAQHKKLGSLILVTPLTNAKEQAKNTGLSIFSWIAGNAFNNLERIRHCPSPTHIIHGTHDEVLHYKMGQKLYRVAANPASFTTLKNETHNTLSSNPKYWETLKKIIEDSG